MKNGLYMIVNTLRCRNHSVDAKRGQFNKFRRPAGAGIGKVVNVIGPPETECGCCVSAMPTWDGGGLDPRGYTVRKDNLAPFKDPDTEEETEREEVA